MFGNGEIKFPVLRFYGEKGAEDMCSRELLNDYKQTAFGRQGS